MRRHSPRERGASFARKHTARLSLLELIDLQDQLDGEVFFTEGVLSPKQEERLDAIAGSVHRKIELIGTSICEEEDVIAGIVHAEHRLAERRRVFLRRIERKKDYLHLCMSRLEIRKVEGTLCTVTLQRNAMTARRPATGPQSDLFTTTTPRAPSAPGSHVRIR